MIVTVARRLTLSALFAAAVLSSQGCGAGSLGDARTPTANKWLDRARQDFATANVDEAYDAVRKALSLAPEDEEVRELAARISLSRLDYDETIRLLKGITGSSASGLRGRAHWYKGDLELAADELEATLEDPEVRDDWAKSIAKLARRGTGRKPFSISGALLAPVEMPHVSPTTPYFVVPVEIDGESALALISTGTAEVVIDSSTREEPSWISLRFDKRLEVHDVPAIAKDLSGLSNEMGTRIKVMLGVNLLRHLHATIDYGGRQFVARSFAPPPPPNATRVSLFYARGGGMLLPGALGSDDRSRAALFVDTSMRFPLALDEGGWKKAGRELSDLRAVPEDPQNRWREGVVPMLRLGAYDIPEVQAVYGAPIEDIEKGLSFDIDGVIGSALLAHFRVTFGDGGRLMWIEDEQSKLRLLQGGGQLMPGGQAMPMEPVNTPEGPAMDSAPPAGPAPAAPPSGVPSESGAGAAPPPVGK